MTSLLFTNNVTQYPTSGATVTTNSMTVMGQNTSFMSWVVPGNQIAIQTTPPKVRTITAVISDTQLSVSQSSNVTTATAFTYSGYFTNPSYETHPTAGTSGNVEYPGGAVEITSNSGSGTLFWGLTNVNIAPQGQPVVLQGALFAYDTSLNLRWCTLSSCTLNNSGFTLGARGGLAGMNGATAFGLPTIVNGYIYIPTNGITGVAQNSTTCTISPSNPSCNGVLVYNGNQ